MNTPHPVKRIESFLKSVTRRAFVRMGAGVGATLGGSPSTFAQSSAAPASLDSLFQNPPDASKVWVYWWWLNGNVSRDGITRDLEEMKRQAINGVLLFHAGGGRGPKGPAFLSRDWMELFRFAVAEAARLGMEMSINLCDGWDSGGTWIDAEAANKKLVYSEIQVDGPRAVRIQLPTPPLVDGWYRDVAVVALPERPRRPVQPASVQASSTVQGYCHEWNWPPAQVVDGDPQTVWRANPKTPPAPEKPQWIEWWYHEPLSATAIHLVPAPDGGPADCELQTSDDGKQYRPVTAFQMNRGEARRAAFSPTSAKCFRLLIKSAHVPDIQLSEAWLLREGDEPAPRPGIKWWAFKSGNRSFWDWPKQGPIALEDEYPEDQTSDVRSDEIIDLTSFCQPGGVLDWTAAPGRWTILRFGYTLEGQRTRCSATNEIGYEANMLDRQGIERQFHATADRILELVPGHVGRTLRYVHIDSYELGADIRGQQPTWTAAFRNQFQERRGYDLLRYLPAMAGRIVDSRERTGRFFWDFRRTIGDLMAQEFFGRLAELAHSRHVGMHAETGYGTYPHPHIDGLECAGKCDVTMGEFWHGTDIMSQFDHFCNAVRSVASAAHVYGRTLIQAESFTSWNHFAESPATLKAVGDQAFSDGLNRMVVHQYTHQPLLTGKPGGQYGAGTHLDRNLTWWDQSRAWLLYLARCQHLLQQGRFHADVAYFYGEGVTRFVPGRDHLRPALPRGYNFDCVNADVLLHRLSVRGGRLMLPNGIGYALLVLPEERMASPGVLAKIRELIESGATVLGPKPRRAPGLTGYPNCDAQVRALSDALWGPEDVPAGDRSLGKGRLLWGRTPEEALAALGMGPDFEVRHGAADTRIEFTHRTLDGAEVYFLSNQQPRAEAVTCVFRVSGKQPELWNPVSGVIRDLPEFRGEGGRTAVPLHFAPHQSWFVVFRRPGATAATGAKNPAGTRPLFEIPGPWQVSFDPQWGGPESIVFDKLEDWTTHANAGIKYYSGKATYRKSFDLPADVKVSRDVRLLLDLGRVQHIAEVRLNGRPLGVVWCAPWQVDIAEAVKPRANVLEIDIVNLWPNRLVGDAQSAPGKRYTRTNVELYKSDSQLLSSGLLGPVTLQVDA